MRGNPIISSTSIATALLVLAVKLSLTCSQQDIVVNNDGSDQQVVMLQQQCRAPKPSVVGGGEGGTTSPRQYLVGANTWHMPVLDYLTDVIGPEFDPPISFVRRTANKYLMVPIEESLAIGYDFMVANPYQTSCYESEANAVSLATQVFINQDIGTGEFYNLTQYGATLYVLNNRTDIQTVADVKGKKIGTNKIRNLATHLCYDVLLRNGVHHLQDPEQTIFFKNSNIALEALLAGKVDVGCAATSILEKYIDPNTGQRLDLSQLRILNPQQQHTTTTTNDDGVVIPFPFRISSDLVPGYLFVAFPHVEQSVTSRVQKELLAMVDHADVAPSLMACLDGKVGCSVNNTQCVQDCFQELPMGTIRNCDTTPERALKAMNALSASGIVKFTEPQQNLRLRDIQEKTHFLIKDPFPQCVRMKNIVDATSCPSEHFARSSEEIVQQCEVLNLPCYDTDCICSPCVEAFEVDFFTDDHEEHEHGQNHSLIVGSGCSKFAICGSVEQEHTLSFHAIDNKGRLNATLTGALLLEDESEDIFTFESKSNGTFYHYDFSASNLTTGQKIIKIRLNNKEISESPFRIIVRERDCITDTGDELQVPNEWGQCVCKSGTVLILDKCVSLSILLPSILVPSFVLFLVAVHCYVRYKRDEADNVWRVDPTELKFDEPPRVLGRGAYGFILMAEYRGCTVAVKQVLPADEKNTSIPLGRLPPSQIEFSGVIENHAGTRSGFSTMSTPPIIVKGRLESSPPGSRNVPDEFRSNALTLAGGIPSSGVASSTLSSRFVPRPIVVKRQGSHIVEKIRLLPRNLFRKRKASRRQKNFVEEIRLLSRLRHPCITTIMGAVFTSKMEPMQVMEYMHFGSLHDLLHNESMVLEGTELIGVLQDVASGLRFLHSSDPLILHGDLKSQNILVDNKFRAKVADFGCGHLGISRKGGTTIQRGGSQPKGKIRGTPYWMAPELLRGETTNTMASDVYAFGIVMYEVFSRKEPYAGESYDEVLRLLSDEAANKRPAVPDNCPAEAAKVMRACLKWNPADRPSATGLDICLRWLDGNSVVAPNSRSRQNKQENRSSRMDLIMEQMFPPHIAQALKEGLEVEPETHEEVTIVFSEIARIADIANAISASKMSDLLDRVYTLLDEICEQKKLCKVATIGDAYMAVTNLMEPQPNHASLAARFAIDALLVASSVPIDVDDQSFGFVELRMGFHTGPVVTHVIGTNTPRFTLIGDTVNMAAMMERNSKPGKIHCSEDSYRLISTDEESSPESGEFEVVERGVMQVQGKGIMKTFWIEPGSDRVETC